MVFDVNRTVESDQSSTLLPLSDLKTLVQTIPNKLPELLINLSSQGPHLMGATLSNLLRAVHPGTIAMTDFRQRLRPKVLTRHLGDL